MAAKKEFDCVEMKRRIQDELARDHAAPTPREQFERMVRDLTIGDDPVSRKWRKLLDRHESTAKARAK